MKSRRPPRARYYQPNNLRVTEAVRPGLCRSRPRAGPGAAAPQPSALSARAARRLLRWVTKAAGSSMRALVLILHLGSRERLEAQPVDGIGGVRDQLAQEYFLVAVKRVDRQVQDLGCLGLKAEVLLIRLHRHRLSPASVG